MFSLPRSRIIKVYLGEEGRRSGRPKSFVGKSLPLLPNRTQRLLSVILPPPWLILPGGGELIGGEPSHLYDNLITY